MDGFCVCPARPNPVSAERPIRRRGDVDVDTLKTLIARARQRGTSGKVQ
ncbi:MAG: hypothetical protein ACE1Y3_10490 [Rhodospirillales bacterium]